jgi:N-acetylmuramoyl-L-alanine amidase
MANLERHIRNFSWHTYRNITGIVLHGSYTTSKQRSFSWANIERIHTQEKGYNECGYHFVINRKPFKNSDPTHWENYVETGRPLNKNGAHCIPVNKTSIGICLIGGRPETIETPNQWEDNYTIMQKTVAIILIRSLTNYFPSIKYCKGHREMQDNRTCPGVKFAFEFDRRPEWKKLQEV